MTQHAKVATGQGAGSDIFLRIQAKRAGLVKGEVTDAGHVDEIQLTSWHWGLAASSAIGSTQATGRRSYTGLTVVKSIDASTTRLMSLLVTNDEVKEAVLSVRKAGGTQGDYFTITLNSARVVGLTHGTDDAGMTKETVVINFTKVKVEYRDQGKAGGMGATSTCEDEIIPA